MAWDGYIALGSVTNNTFTESSAAGYARKKFNFRDATAAGLVQGAGSPITFTTTAPGTTSVTAYAFYAGVSGGASLLVYPISMPLNFNLNISITVNPYSVVFNLVDAKTDENLGLIGLSNAGAITGVNIAAKNNTSAIVAPTSANDITQGYDVGSVWVNTTGPTFYTCTVATATAAVWTTTGASLAYTDVTNALGYTPVKLPGGNTGIKHVGIIIPYYVYVSNPYNTSAFSALLTQIRSNQNVPVIIIVNQSGVDGLGGPGPLADAAVLQTIKMLRAAGATVVGYVSTSNATRSSTLVKADIISWSTLYPGMLDGVFFDELPYDPGVGNANITLYKSYYNYAHQNGYSLVIGNPGTQQTSPWYDGKVADIYVCYENTSWPTLASFLITPPQYYSGATTDYPREQFAVLVYNSAWSSSSFNTLAPYFGWIYATDNPSPASVGSPWSALPTYLSSLFAAAKAL